MSGPRGLFALVFSCSCGVVAGPLLASRHPAWWALLPIAGASIIVNGVAGWLDARAGWHLWKREGCGAGRDAGGGDGGRWRR